MNEKQHTSSLTESPTCHSTPPSQSCHHASPHSCHHASSIIRHAPTKRLPQHPYRINPAAGSQPTKLISATGDVRNAPPPHQRERSIASCPLPKRKAHHRELQQMYLSAIHSISTHLAISHTCNTYLSRPKRRKLKRFRARFRACSLHIEMLSITTELLQCLRWTLTNCRWKITYFRCTYNEIFVASGMKQKQCRLRASPSTTDWYRQSLCR